MRRRAGDGTDPLPAILRKIGRYKWSLGCLIVVIALMIESLRG